jgi:hypothetical protein
VSGGGGRSSAPSVRAGAAGVVACLLPRRDLWRAVRSAGGHGEILMSRCGKDGEPQLSGVYCECSAYCFALLLTDCVSDLYSRLSTWKITAMSYCETDIACEEEEGGVR